MRKKNETDEQNSEDVDYIDDDRTNSKKLVSNLRQSGRGKLIYSTGFLCEKTNNIILNTVQHENLIRCELSSVVRSV